MHDGAIWTKVARTYVACTDRTATWHPAHYYVVSNMSRILEYTCINEYLPHKEKTCSASKGVCPYATIKTQRPSRKRYTQFLYSLYSLTLLELSFDLTFGGSLAGTTSRLSVRSFSVLGRSGVECVGNVLGLL